MKQVSNLLTSSKHMISCLALPIQWHFVLVILSFLQPRIINSFSFGEVEHEDIDLFGLSLRYRAFGRLQQLYRSRPSNCKWQFFRQSSLQPGVAYHHIVDD